MHVVMNLALPQHVMRFLSTCAVGDLSRMATAGASSDLQTSKDAVSDHCLCVCVCDTCCHVVRMCDISGQSSRYIDKTLFSVFSLLQTIVGL